MKILLSRKYERSTAKANSLHITKEKAVIKLIKKPIGSSDNLNFETKLSHLNNLLQEMH